MNNEFQKSWDELLKKHRMDLVTHVSHETLEHFTDLKLISLTAHKPMRNFYRAEFEKSKDRYVIAVSNEIRYSVIEICILKNNEYLIADVLNFSQEKKQEKIPQEEKIKIGSFLNEIKKWIIEQGK